MKILFITFSDITICSSSNIRNISLIKGFLDLGYSVDIVSYRMENKAALTDQSFAPIVSKCRVLFLSAANSTEKISSSLVSSNNQSIKTKIYNRLRKIYYSLESVDSLRKIANRINISNLDLGNYDVMISSSNPYSVHILANRIRNQFFSGKIRWIQYWGDALYLDTLTRKPIFPFRVKKAERNLLSSCDKIVYTNGVVLDLQRKLFPEYSMKMTFVETPFAFKKEFSNQYVYDVGYFGSYSSSVRDILPLFSVLKNGLLKSIIVGNGDQPIKSIGNLSVLPRASVNEVMEYENNTRVLVCICNKLSKSGETGLIPGKVYHYGSTEKPVLVIGATPKVKSFLEKYNRFYFADNDEMCIKEAIEDMLLNKPERQESLLETIPRFAASKLLD